MVNKAAPDVERPVRLQVSITEDASAGLDELARITGMSRNVLGAMALQVGITIVGQSIRHALGQVTPEQAVAELGPKVTADLRQVIDARLTEE